MGFYTTWCFRDPGQNGTAYSVVKRVAVRLPSARRVFDSESLEPLPEAPVSNDVSVLSLESIAGGMGISRLTSGRGFLLGADGSLA